MQLIGQEVPLGEANVLAPSTPILRARHRHRGHIDHQ